MGTADPAGRALALLGLLQSGRAWSGPDLAARLGVSSRTVRRDAERLRSLGYAVETRPGPGGSYRLGSGTVLPPLVLDDDEVTAVVLGLRMVQHRLDADDPAGRALATLERMLPARLRAVAAATGAATEALPGRQTTVPAATVAALAEATTGSGRVRFDYRDQHDRASTRLVDPYRQVFRNGNWLLLGVDVDRDGWRSFRLDRVTDVERVPGTYARRDLPADSVAEYLGTDFARPPLPVSVVFHAAAPTVTHRLPLVDAELEPLAGERCRYRTHVASLTWFAATTAVLGVPFHVEEPAELAEQCRVLAGVLGVAGAHPGGSPA